MSTDLVPVDHYSRVRNRFLKNIFEGEQQFWLWEQAQRYTYRAIIPMFEARWGEKISLGKVSRLVNQEIEHQRSTKDRSADLMREAGTTMMEQIYQERWDVYEEARKKGATKTANEVLSGMEQNIMDRLKIHGAIAPATSVVRNEGEVTVEHRAVDSVRSKIDQLVAAADEFEEQRLNALLVAQNAVNTPS